LGQTPHVQQQQIGCPWRVVDCDVVLLAGFVAEDWDLTCNQAALTSHPPRSSGSTKNVDCVQQAHVGQHADQGSSPASHQDVQTCAAHVTLSLVVVWLESVRCCHAPAVFWPSMFRFVCERIQDHLPSSLCTLDHRVKVSCFISIEKQTLRWWLGHGITAFAQALSSSTLSSP
jgi:hypothetical protein